MNLLREKLRAVGAHRLLCADSPDTSGMNAAAVAQAELGKEALEFYKRIYQDTAPDRKRASDAALEQSGVQTDLARFSLDRARKEADRYDTTFQPIEKRIADEAMTYDTPDRREAAARAAVADTEMALANARDSSRRALERRGVMPGSGASLALEGSQNLGAARLNASAANTARREVETIGAARRMDAAGLGRGVVSNQATQASLGLQAGNSGVTNATVPVQVASQGAQLGAQGFQTAMQGQQGAGNLYGQITGLNQASSASNASTWSALGSAAAMIAFSDENMKEGKKPVRGEVALEAARRMPVKQWRYKADSQADDGGKEHVGPMAQAVQAAAGEQAAPGGKVVDLVTMNGITLAAVQALDRKVQRLEKRRRRG